MPHRLFSLCLCLIFAALAPLELAGQVQVVDTFSDGDLQDPEWFGDTDDFVVSEGRLRLMAENGGRSQLGLPLRPELNLPADTFRLELLVDMAFSPSGSNFTEVFLSSGPDFAGGDVIRMEFGGISGDQDTWEIELSRGGGTTVGSATASPGALGSEPAVVRFRVEKNGAGPWNFLADFSGGNDFLLVGTVADEQGLVLNYLNIVCNYTATRSDRFSFDDLSATSSAPGEVEPVNAASADNLFISEFMADPTPTVGLPDAEYVELYNPSDTTISLLGVALGSGGSPAPLAGNLAPQSYLLLVDADDADLFADTSINVLPIDLPGLSNGGDNLSLVSGGDTLLTLNYTDDWYNDPDRDEGGYSLELTSLDGADAGCSGRWRASLDDSGGTPGRVNSVLGNPAPGSAPAVVSSNIDSAGITISFDAAPIAGEPDFVVLDGDTEIPLTSVRATDAGRTFQLSFLSLLESGTFYRLVIPPLADCVGNRNPEQTITLGIPSTPVPGDVLINEILFNPASGSNDYVELYNATSTKIFQINGWVVSNEQSTSSNATEVIGATRLFLPGEYLVFTEDADDLLTRYPNADPSVIVEQDLPSLPNDEGNITLRASLVTLDSFDYSDDLHSPFLDDLDGISLERLRINDATNNRGNWFSAASTTPGGTPTQPNSQDRREPRPDVTDVVGLVNETFSPDGDGFEDLLEIVYQDVPVGSIARVRIYDAQGRLVRTLRDAELLGVSGTIVWDGADDDGLKARVGIHVIVIELSTADGPAETFKLPAVLAGDR